MKKILLSLGMIVFVAAGVALGTGAFYGDVETSTGNTFTAGAIELLVDSESHYNGMVCAENGTWQPSNNPTAFGDTVGFPVRGSECDGTWAETDLEDGVHTFFNFLDLKPGDHGEDTISLHVYDNDAWGQFLITEVSDRDNTCTDPETVSENAENNNTICSDPNGDGEVDDNLRFSSWLDQGSTPGFQNGDKEQGDDGWDDEEGDNIFQEEYEGPYIWNNTLIGDLGPFELSQVFGAAYSIFGCDQTSSPIGHNEYGLCHGLAEDGRMVGSTTYYFGLAWDLPLSTGNEVQTDEYIADLTFRVEQHRNNPTPFGS